MTKKRKITIIVSTTFIILMLFISSSCSSCNRFGKSCASEVNDGMIRTVKVYDYQGDLIAEHSGKIDVQSNESKVLFDLDGKRYIYYNCLVEVIEN